MKAPLSSVLALLACTLAANGADQKKASAAKSGAAAEVSKTATTAESGVKDVTLDEAEKLVKEKNVTVLDVRTPEEFQTGHITNAKNLDALDGEFEESLAKLDRNQSYLLHCAAGGRSAGVLNKMKELGFKSIYHMPGGIRGWKESGKPLEK